jgi:hypothetical protein
MLMRHSRCIITFGGVVLAMFLASAATAGDIRKPWTMHHIHDGYLIANSLNAMDVNGDGLLDYSVIDEAVGLQTIIFHPGKGADVRKPWPRVTLGKTGNPEYSCLGDLDGDGNADLVVVEGDDLERGLKTDVRVHWGPPPAKATDPSAWKDAGHIPGTGGQQYLYCECHDIDGDGAVDILVGGRRRASTNTYAGFRWLKSPKGKAERRDLTQWRTYFISPDTYSAHGWTMADVDQDGDIDIVDANADWDTPASEEELHWYDNPGAGKPAQLEPWPRHKVWKDTQFYAKPQVGVGDVNGDGLTDLVTQTQNSVHVFLKTGLKPVAWDHVPIPKPDLTQWIGRPIRFVDLNGDGRLDILGALIHNDGNLPKDKASVFWMEYEGDRPGKAWRTHVLKQSDGYNSRDQWIGEKWDHLLPIDVDGDGDLDIVGNVEEHYHRVGDRDESFFSVVWFENPMK